MNYDEFFADAIGRLWHERRYRVFADLERIAGRFPRALQGSRKVVSPNVRPPLPRSILRSRRVGGPTMRV
jgi:hypothetical protein